MLGGEGRIENRYFRVAAQQDGSVQITDKEENVVLPHCNWFVDEGDRGDEYNFDPLQTPQVVSAPVSAPKIAVDAGNPVVATLTTEQTYALPRKLEADRETRSHDSVPVPITTRVQLYGGVKRIDFETEVDNAAADHRLRVHFRTPLVVRSAFPCTARDLLIHHLDLIEAVLHVAVHLIDGTPGDAVVWVVLQRHFPCPVDEIRQSAVGCVPHRVGPGGERLGVALQTADVLEVALFLAYAARSDTRQQMGS